MFHDLDFTDRRTRQHSGLNHRRRGPRPALAGEKDFYNPRSPEDFREYRTVLNYSRR
ncbi:hypothetical protein ACTOB_003678 [Actinoplanes oblitus]|uniref:Uncharacterized protein n=1 Tax=Actinoplanes oblitus TaxID=3040509 RepID=A0ABY8WUF0_9ACTN|nr:hypothetical protein [Actinoplanes oblitus]WIN00005.1 hypothetical protein ACTOB_003678 [Actinoplanes oblitus]